MKNDENWEFFLKWKMIFNRCGDGHLGKGNPLNMSYVLEGNEIRRNLCDVWCVWWMCNGNARIHMVFMVKLVNDDFFLWNMRFPEGWKSSGFWCDGPMARKGSALFTPQKHDFYGRRVWDMICGMMHDVWWDGFFKKESGNQWILCANHPLLFIQRHLCKKRASVRVCT